jgi:hypothetical protein
MDIGKCKDRTEQQTAEASVEKNSFCAPNTFFGVEQRRRYLFAQVTVLYEWNVSSGGLTSRGGGSEVLTFAKRRLRCLLLSMNL